MTQQKQSILLSTHKKETNKHISKELQNFKTPKFISSLRRPFAQENKTPDTVYVGCNARW